MHILKPITSIQILQLIPRVYVSGVTLSIFDTELETTETIVTTGTSENGYLVITDIFTMTEGKNYTFDVNVTSNGILIYRGQIYCTSQTDFYNYKMNQNGYSAIDENNDLITF